MSFLNALGSIGGGFSRSVDPALNAAIANQPQMRADTAAGNALFGAIHPQSPLAGLLARFGLGGQGQQPQAAPDASSALAPQQSQPSMGATPQQPTPQQGATPQQGQSGFPAAVQFTMQHEGGLNPSDSNGSPSNYGINQAAHPDVDVGKLTPQDAQQIYKTQYWDAVGGDRLPPQLQKMVFDTAVMSSPHTANAMLQASGGDPQKFMALRQQFQAKLLATDPAKYGKYAHAWATRNQALTPQAGASGGPSPQSPQPGPSAPLPPIQQMQLPQIVQRLKQANPNASPGELFRGLERIAPMMNAGAKQQVEMLRLQLQQANYNTTHADRQQANNERHRHNAAEEGLSAGRIGIAKQKLTDINTRFGARMAAAEEKLKLATTQAEKVAAAKELNATIAEAQKARQLVINAENGMGPSAEMAPIIAESKAAAKVLQERADAAIKASRAPAPAAPTGAAPTGEAVKVKTAAEAAALKPGTLYSTPDGQQFTR